MRQHQKDTDFLKRLIHFEGTEESRQLEARISEVEKEERVVRSALAQVAVLAALSVSGLCYAAILLPDFPHNKSQWVLKLFLVLGLTSLICLIAFAGVWVRCRAILGGLRDRGRDLLSAALERMHTIPFPRNVKEQDFPLYKNRTVVAEKSAESA